MPLARTTSPPHRLAGLVVVALVIAITAAGCGAEGPSVTPRADASVGYVGGKSLTMVAPAERKAAPDVSGPALDGDQSLSTADYPGKVIVLNVWGSWCAPCRKEAPDLAAASKKTQQTAQFIGINSRDYDRAPAQAFVRAFKVPYPNIYDPQGKLLVRFNGDLPPTAIPATLILDQHGRIAVRIVGTVSEGSLVQMINDVAAGK